MRVVHRPEIQGESRGRASQAEAWEWGRDLRQPREQKILSEGIRNRSESDDQKQQRRDVVGEMAAELEKKPHVHWAFSVAWAIRHPDYEGIVEGVFARAREIAQALVIDFGNYDACSPADSAHAALLERDTHRRPVGVLADAEPAKDEASRQRAALELVDFVLRYLSRRRRDGHAVAHSARENHEVTLQAKEESAAELCSSDLDERAPHFLPLKRGSSILRSPYQAPKAPPGGIDLDGMLSAKHIASNLAEMLIPEYGRFEPEKENVKL